MTSARFALVIFVACCTRSSRNSCKKLIINSTTRRWIVGSRPTMATHWSGSSAHPIHSLYSSWGMRGSSNSRSQSFKRLAGTWGSSIPSRVYTPLSIRSRSSEMASASPGTRNMPSCFVPPRARMPSARNGRMTGILRSAYVRSWRRYMASRDSPNVEGLNAASC